MKYPKLKDRWTSEDFTSKVIRRAKTRKIEEIFSRQLRSLPTNEFEKRIFSLKEVI